MKSLNISKGTLARTIILFLALINQLLTMTGHSVIPIKDEEITEFISLAWTFVAAVVAWWKNNSFTEAAIEADKVLNALKEETEVNREDGTKEDEV